MQRVASAMLIIMLFTLAACRRDPASIIANGNKYFDRQKYKEAAILYKTALKKDPKNGEAYYRLGLADLKLQAIGEAYSSFRRALDLNPANTDAATKLADICWLVYISDSKKYKTMLTELRDLDDNLLKRDPRSFDGFRFAGYLALADQNIPEALSNFQKANQSKPYVPELSMALANTLLASNRVPEAEKVARDLIDHQKNYAPMYDMLVTLYIKSNRLAEAEALLKEKVANNSKQEVPYLQLAMFYSSTQRRPEMESALQRLLADPKDFPMAHLTVGRFFARLKDFDRARREYDEGLKTGSKEKATYQKAIVELLVNTGKPREAQTILEDVLKDNPKDVQAIQMRSSLRLLTGKPEEVSAAVIDLQALVAKSPDNAIYHYDLGRALMAKGAPDQARVQLEEAMRLRPDLNAPKLMLAQLLIQKREYGRALQISDDVLRVDGNSLPGHLVRSSSLLGMGEKDKAKAELDLILKAAPNSSDAKFQLGILNYQEKNFKEADSIFRGMQETNPGDSRGLIGLVETQVAQKDFSDAIKMMDTELAKDPNRNDYRLALANIEVRAEHFDDAIKNYQMLIAKNPKSADFVTKLAETYRLKGDINAAIDNFRKASALSPTDPVPLTRLALLLQGIGRVNEAKPLYEQILHVAPDEPVALNNLAFIKAEEGSDLDQALSLAQRAKQRLPQDANISDTLGLIYIKKNLSEDAVRLFKDLVTKDPSNPTYRYHLAMALFQKGDRPNAKKECEGALQNHPSKDEQDKIRVLMSKLG
jgi:tetratricopeptide (TPR) repeat protein